MTNFGENYDYSFSPCALTAVIGDTDGIPFCTNNLLHSNPKILPFGPAIQMYTKAESSNVNQSLDVGHEAEITVNFIFSIHWTT